MDIVQQAQFANGHDKYSAAQEARGAWVNRMMSDDTATPRGEPMRYVRKMSDEQYMWFHAECDRRLAPLVEEAKAADDPLYWDRGDERRREYQERHLPILRAISDEMNARWPWDELAGKPIGWEIGPQNWLRDDAHDMTDAKPEAGRADTDDIIDIFGMLTPEPVLRPDMLPKPIHDFAVDVAARMGVSLPTVAMVALGVCAGALHSDIRVQVRQHDTEWVERPTLWLMGIGDPSMKKSPALDAASKPLERIEREWREVDQEVIKKYEKALVAYKEQSKVWNRLIAQGKDAGPEPQEPEEPMRRRLLADDFTMEALRDILAVNPRGVLVKADELAAFVGGFDAYKPGKTGGDRAKALRLFNGGQYVVDRIGVDVLVPNWCAGIVGNIQDAKLAGLAKTLTDDGLMQRFIVYRIERAGAGEDRVPNFDALDRYEMLIRWLANREPTGKVVRWSADAQDIRREVEGIINALVAMPALSPALKGNLGKFDAIFARLTLTMHAVDLYDRHGYMLAEPDFHSITAETAKRARDLTIRFLIPSAVTIYREFFGQHDEFGNDARWIAGYILAHECTTVSERDLYRAKHDFQDERVRLRRACDALIEANWLTGSAGTQQANSSVWMVNPQVHTKFADRAKTEKETRELGRQKIIDHTSKLHEAWIE